ncbi:hypothetical protein SAY86_012460 [Trapa natans]|uniref:Uncharacterized protein n=1 Tax=Trapa natans TaxID=22666 RepID=A0AAN7MCW4_TRANT|nr:hypothetical protein SAY86_012460 [Trapa natans]
MLDRKSLRVLAGSGWMMATRSDGRWQGTDYRMDGSDFLCFRHLRNQPSMDAERGVLVMSATGVFEVDEEGDAVMAADKGVRAIRPVMHEVRLQGGWRT